MRRILLFILLLSLAAWGEPELKVEVLKQGQGPAIKSGQEAQIGYTLTLESGKLIDQANALKPFRFVVGSDKVISGFSQAVEGMKIGEIRQILIPPELGYGDKAVGPIPPNSTLVFQIELYGIGPAPAKSQAHQSGQDPNHDSAGHEDHDHDAPGHEGHDHDAAGHEGHDHGDRELAEAFQDEEFLSKRNAQDITRPAMYEYLLREFYTKPWRSEDGYKSVGYSTLKMCAVLVLLLGFSWIATRKGYLSK